MSLVDQLHEQLSHFKVVDLSHGLEEGMPSFPSHTKYQHILCESDSDPAVMFTLHMNEHSGTHVDAPLHYLRDMSFFDSNRDTIDRIELESLLGKGLVIRLDKMQNELVTIADLLEWEVSNQKICSAQVIIFDFGWHKKWATDFNDHEFSKGWPGISREAANYLFECKVAAVGTDCLSLDTQNSVDIPAHDTLLKNGVLILENLANLNVLSGFFYFAAFPLKIIGGSGSPIRAVALVPREGK